MISNRLEQERISGLQASVKELLSYGLAPTQVLEIFDKAVQAIAKGELPGGTSANAEVDSFRDEPKFQMDSIFNIYLAVKDFPDLSQILVHSMLGQVQLAEKYKKTV